LAVRIGASRDMEVCGEASDAAEALELLASTNPHLVIVDLALKDSHGLDLIKDIRRRGDEPKILVISAYDETFFAERALRAGAQGYINKQELRGKINDAIHAVLSGQLYVSKDMTRRMMEQAINVLRREARGVEGLTDREIVVFEMIGRGTSTRKIAEQLGLSVHTIETHREKIRAKLGLENSAELMQRAVQWLLEKGA
jgi:DNA-binding NarL/FixJ family response regulator